MPDGRRGYVTVCGVDGNKVKLGFQFDPDINIVRMEAKSQTVIDRKEQV